MSSAEQVDAPNEANFDSAYDQLIEAGLDKSAASQIAGSVLGIKNALDRGRVEDADVRLNILNDDMAHMEGVNGDDALVRPEVDRAVEELIKQTVGKEGLQALGIEDNDESTSEKLIQDGVAAFKQALADRDADAVIGAYKSAAEAIANTGGDTASRDKLFIKFLDKTSEGVSKEEHDWLNGIDLDENELADIVRGNKGEAKGSKQGFDAEKAKARLDEAGLKDTESRAFSNDVGLIADLVKSDNKLDMLEAKKKHDTLEAGIEWAVSEGRMDAIQGDAVRDLLAKSIGQEGLENIDVATKRLDSIKEGLVSSGLFDADTADAIYEQVWKFVTAKEAKDADGVNEAFVNIKTVIEESTEDEDERAAMIDEIMDNADLYGKKVPRVGEEDGSGIDAARLKRALESARDDDMQDVEEEDKESLRDRIKGNLKARWGKLKAAVLTRDVKLAVESVFGNEDGEKTKRNALVALGVGAAALAVVIANSKNWIDVNPFDGNGIDLNPLDNADSVPTETNTGNSSGSKVAESVDVSGYDADAPETPRFTEAPKNPSDYGIDLSTDMPWEIANKVAPGNENTAIQNMMDTYSNQIGQPVTLNGNGMISVGDHITTPTELSQMNEILFNQAA